METAKLRFIRILAVTIAIGVLVVQVDVVSATNDPCSPNQYAIISDSHRSTSFIPGPTDSLNCDVYTIVSGQWYRFQNVVGGTMPESCVATFHCGTQAPIWLNGQHPTVTGQIVQRQVCANFGYPNSCCSWSANVQVVRCNDAILNRIFYVYRLASPTACPVAYCAGDKMVCPNGQLFNNYTQNCEALNPEFSNVQLSNPVVEDGFIKFHCSWNFTQPPTRDNGARFIVSFYFDNVRVKNSTVTVSAPLNSAAFDEQWLRGNLGKSLSCGVVSYWDTYEDYRGVEKPSNSYFVGIVVDPPRLVINQNASISSSVMLKSTLPITCKTPGYQGVCEITVRVVTPTQLVASQGLVYLQCQYRIERESWRPDEHLAYNDSEPLLVTIKKDAGSNTERVELIHFEKFPTEVPDIIVTNGTVRSYPSIWDGYQIPDLQVLLMSNARTGSCQSMTDPRIMGWQNKGYDLISLVGEFVLWNSNSSRISVAHIRNWPCNYAWYASCTCGIAVREDSVILTVDICDGNPGDPPRPLVTQVTADGDLRGASVTRDPSGTLFSINMPSGLYVKMDVHDWGMNLYAFAPSSNLGTTYGLCGNFDGPQDPNFPSVNIFTTNNHFAELWRITPGQSLFDKVPTDLGKTIDAVMFCDCDVNEQVTCDWQKQVGTIVTIGKPTIELPPLIPKPDGLFIGRRRRRDLTSDAPTSSSTYTDYVVDARRKPFNYALLSLPQKIYTWPTPVNGYTQAYAMQYCWNTLRSASAYPVCQNVTGIDFGAIVDRCVSDIQVMDDLSWAENAVTDMQFQCLARSIQTTQTTGNSSNSSSNQYANSTSPSAPQIVAQHICPRQCSGVGTCQNGTCLCNSGYLGADCSVQVGQLPVAAYLENDGLCDVSQRPCRLIRVAVSGIYDSPQLTCQSMIATVNFVTGQLTSTGDSVILNGTMISASEMWCELPETGVSNGTAVVSGVVLSVSTDGVHFSNELFLTIYDSTCMQCNTSAQCWKKVDSCLVTSECFAEGEGSPQNWCQMCLPTNDQFGFVPRTDAYNKKPVMVSSTSIMKLTTETFTTQLVAQDPENQPITFSVSFTTDPMNVFVNSSGFLTWFAGWKSKAYLEITVADICGSGMTFEFNLLAVPCNCTNSGTCVQDPAYSWGQGRYLCSCPTGYTGELCEVLIDNCASRPCVHGQCTNSPGVYSCSCYSNYTGPNCDTLVYPSYPGADNVTGGLWTGWGLFSACSLPCDYGIQTRQRVCLNMPCIGNPSDVRECNTDPCAEDMQLQDNGLVFIIDHTPVVTIRLRQTDILTLLSTYINTYCQNRPDFCCKSMAVVDRISSNNGTVTGPFVNPDDIYFAPSFPRMMNDTEYALKVIGTVDLAYVRALCLNHTSPGSGKGSFSVDSHFLKDVWQQAAADLANLYSVYITEVLLPDEYAALVTQQMTTPSLDEARSTGSSSLLTTWSIAVIVVGLACIIVVIVVVSLLLCRTKFKGKHNRTPSQKRLTHEDLDQVDGQPAQVKVKTNAKNFFFGFRPQVSPDPSAANGAEDGSSNITDSNTSAVVRNVGPGLDTRSVPVNLEIDVNNLMQFDSSSLSSSVYADASDIHIDPSGGAKSFRDSRPAHRVFRSFSLRNPKFNTWRIDSVSVDTESKE